MASSKNKILILGGTSSLAKNFLESKKSLDYEITLTYKSAN